jgi:hypothetical protein
MTNNSTVHYFTTEEYQRLRDHCICVCGHRRARHDHTQYCLACTCRRYGRRTGWKRGLAADRVSMADQTLFENEGTAGEEWHACMYFDDSSPIVEVCAEQGENVATIEVPLGVVDVTWRRQLARALTYDNSVSKPAAHYLERGCYVTMPLVLCAEHRRAMLL